MKIGVTGATGRLGQAIIRAVLNDSECSLVAAITRHTNPNVGSNLNACLGMHNSDVKISSDLKSFFNNSDVVIDFSNSAVTNEYINAASLSKTPIVIGTTGLNENNHTILEASAKNIPILYSPNMSLAIHVLKRITEKVAQQLGPQFDIEISEMHHKLKQDAPSGTALMLGKAAAKGRQISFDDHAQYTRTGNNCQRQSNEIGFSAIRGGGVPGDHSVIFASDQEVLTLQHRSLSKEIYAHGAITAAKWLKKQAPGLYGMEDTINID